MPDADVFTRHANAALDLVIVRLNVVVRDWPIVAIAIMGARFEIQIAITRNATPPHQCFPTDDLGTHPIVGFSFWSYIRVFSKISKELLVILAGNAREKLMFTRP